MEQAKLRSKVIEVTTQQKPKGATHWSTRSLGKFLGLNHTFVNRVWRKVGLTPHLTATFKVSTDPHFECQAEGRRWPLPFPTRERGRVLCRRKEFDTSVRPNPARVAVEAGTMRNDDP